MIGANKSFLSLGFRTSIIIGCFLVHTFADHNPKVQRNLQDRNGPLGAIPSSLRAQFVERLKLMVEYQSTRRWDKLYDLMPNSILKGMSREEFIKQSKAVEIDPYISTLINFSPTATVLAGQTTQYSQWTVFGCGEYKRKGRIVRLKAGMAAELENEKWFFSEISTITHVDGPEEPCGPTPRRAVRRK